MPMRALTAVGVLCLMQGCAPDAGRGPEPLTLAAAQGAMDSFWTAYSRAAVAGDLDAIGQYYADTVHLAEPGMPTMRSRADLVAVAAEVFKAGRYLSAEMRPEVTEVAGDRIIQAGTYSDVFQATGDVARRSFGRMLVVARRGADGRITISHVNAALDSTVVEPTPSQQ